MSFKRQLSLPFDAGDRPRRVDRKLRARSGVPHRTRAAHVHRHPLHVTLRSARALPSMREESLFLALRRALSQTGRTWFRIVHFSVQADHVHLIVEANDKVSLTRGMTGTNVRLARALNRALGRRGSVWSERFHARALRTPREVRNALVYVLMNRKKHAAAGRGGENSAPTRGGPAETFDPCSSAWWFDGWAEPPGSGPPWPAAAPPVLPPVTWLARTGWKHRGLIQTHEGPRRTLSI